MNEKLQNIFQKNRIMVIDGSMSTALEQMGADLNHALWTARVLAEQPELVRNVHMDYFRAGADCGITASYQATIPGLVKNGYTEEEAEEILRRSIRLFCEARQTWWENEGEAAGRAWPLCLAAIGPYGAYLADGSEYRGNYSITDEELWEFHRRRMEVLWGEGNSGADLLLIETIPSLREALICAELAESLGADYWISFSCKDGIHNNEGTRLSDCAKALCSGSVPHEHLQMLGVNCTDPRYVTSLIQELKSCTDLPIAVYPNSGDQYDPSTKTWKKAGAGMAFGAWASEYMKAGANAVGGCCTTTAEHIRQVAAARRAYLKAVLSKRLTATQGNDI